jgi:hypothetical protein
MGDPEDSRIVSLLLKAGADIDYATKERPKAFDLATSRGNKASAALIRAAMQKNAAGLRRDTRRTTEHKTVSGP